MFVGSLGKLLEHEILTLRGLWWLENVYRRNQLSFKKEVYWPSTFLSNMNICNVPSILDNMHTSSSAHFLTMNYWSERFVVLRKNIEEKPSFHLKKKLLHHTFLSSLSLRPFLGYIVFILLYIYMNQRLQQTLFLS
jgi:hypothetical protein